MAIGLAIATQNVDQPDLTLVRLTETTGADVYRSIGKANTAKSPAGHADADADANARHARDGDAAARGQRGQATATDLPRQGESIPPGVSNARDPRSATTCSIASPSRIATLDSSNSGRATSRA